MTAKLVCDHCGSAIGDGRAHYILDTYRGWVPEGAIGFSGPWPRHFCSASCIESWVVRQFMLAPPAENDSTSSLI